MTSPIILKSLPCNLRVAVIFLSRREAKIDVRYWKLRCDVL